VCRLVVHVAHKARRVWRMVKRDGRRPYPPPMADSDRVLASVYGLVVCVDLGGEVGGLALDAGAFAG